jgi:hypothetical protein
MRKQEVTGRVVWKFLLDAANGHANAELADIGWRCMSVLDSQVDHLEEDDFLRGLSLTW